jgi:hypothetical protein
MFRPDPGRAVWKTKNPPSGGSPRWAACAAIYRFRYRADPPHSGAMLQQQQIQVPILILWLTGHFPSYSHPEESQFTEVSAAG